MSSASKRLTTTRKKPAVSSSPRAHPRPRRPPPVAVAGASDRPVAREIIVTFDEEAVANEGIAALATCPEVFTHAGHLVSLVPSAIPGTALGRSSPVLRIERLPLPRLRELLSRSARWLVPRSDDPGDQIVSQVPQRIVAGIAARRDWPGLRPLAGLVVTPVLRPDGTVLRTAGYDPTTGLYLAPNAQYPPIATRPTRAEAQAAAAMLNGVVNHVPFATPGDRAAWVAMVASIFARFAVGATSPLCIVEDTRAARWGDELVDHLVAIVGADQVASIDAEDVGAAPRRLLDTLLANGESLALLNNRSSHTPTDWKRLQDALHRAHATHGVVWCASIVRAPRDRDRPRAGLSIRCDGADLFIKQDAPRRPLGEPSDGPSVRLASAALTLLRAYQAAGSPYVHLPRWPGFERWSRFVRSAVVWSGCDDPVVTEVAPHDQQPATEAASADLVRGWSELVMDHPGGCSARQALDALKRQPPTKYAHLREALKVFAPGPLDDRSTADRLGRCLTRLRDVEHHGYALVFVASGNQGNRWTVRPTTTARRSER
ncbi:MAG: hypothetical protein JWM10_2455 [Myxococcaceae bacterium]|nr:hypothetical protein [Myxococcaceae bacterium]